MTASTPTPVTAGQLLTAKQLAERWQVKPAHVYRLAREGELQVVKLGRYYRFKLAAVEQFEDQGGLAA